MGVVPRVDEAGEVLAEQHLDDRLPLARPVEQQEPGEDDHQTEESREEEMSGAQGPQSPGRNEVG